MIRTAIIAAALLLPGCATYSEMQATAPVLELTTDKTPDAYAGCVAPKFMDIWGGMVSVIPDGESTVVTVGDGGAMFATLTATPNGSGTHAVMREMGGPRIGTTFDRARVAAQSCT